MLKYFRFKQVMMLVLLCTCTWSLLSESSVHAQTQIQTSTEAMVEADASKRVNRLSDELKSPFCPGKTLLTCTSYQAFALRKEMTEMILAGKSDQEILTALRESFGEILENPPQPWYTILVPIMPFILGALIALWMFSRWLNGSKQDEENAEDAEEVNDEYQARLQALLKDED